jgi:hypothetical protein
MDPAEIKALEAYLNKEATYFIGEFVTYRKLYLQKRGIAATRELIDSLAFEITNRTEDVVMTRIEIAFADYGRYIDVKKLKTADGGEEYIEGLKKWIQSKGLETKMVEGYMKRRNLKSRPANVLNSIAWGIVRKRKITYKRSAWWNKAKTGMINDLYNVVAAGLPDIVADALKKGFNEN